MTKLLAPLLAALALSSVACAEPTAENTADHGKIGSTAIANSGPTVRTQAVFEIGKETLTADLGAFELASEAEVSGEKGGSMMIGKAMYSRLKLHTVGTSLATKLYPSQTLTKVRLTTAAPGEKPQDLAVFNTIFVSKVAGEIDSAMGEEEYELTFMSMDLYAKGGSLNIDRVKYGAKLTGTCPAPKYAHAALSVPLKAGETRLDAAEVSMSIPEATTVSGAPAISKPELDHLSMDLGFDMSALCNLYNLHMVLITPVTTMLDYSDLAEKPTVTRQWDACKSAVTAVSIKGGGSEAPKAHVELFAQGFVRIEPTGTMGWSFKSAKPITSCTEL